MKRIVLIICIILAIVTVGCSHKFDHLPEITVTSDSGIIGCATSILKWGEVTNESENIFAKILEDGPVELPYIRLGERIYIQFNENPPDSAVMYDKLITEYGGNVYDERVTNEIPLVFQDGELSFVLEAHFASNLSSDSESYKDGNTIRGFKIVCKWGEDECEYGFVIRTDAVISVYNNELM